MMPCSYGFGSCACYTADEWRFSVTFNFSTPEQWDIDVEIELTNLLNIEAAESSALTRENLSYAALLQEEGKAFFGENGKLAGEQPGKFQFLNGAVQFTRAIRKGQVIEFTKMDRTSAKTDAQVWAERDAAYPLPAGSAGDVFRHFTDWPIRAMPNSLVTAQLILPPLGTAEKVGPHAGLHRPVSLEEFPAVFDLHSTDHGGGMVYSTRHFPVNTSSPFFVSPGLEFGEEKFVMVLGSNFGPFRSLPGQLAYPVRDEFPPYQTCYTTLADFGLPPETLWRGYNYYFREDYLLWHRGAGSVRMPGMDWWAKKYWEGQKVTIEGRVFTP
jgi:hypothetical protein